ncbi:FAD binding domain-containing protein [Cladophialophora immunda]|nr:FAD binding domain-containing protein [Cladophialophora immunda]
MDPAFQGNNLKPGTKAYDRANNLYASSTYKEEHDMKPGEILQPTSIEDIQNVIRYANATKKPIAIRTGGHQYSGASSTGPDGIQLDLKPTFRRPNLDLNLLFEDNKAYIRSSVSWTLAEIFDFLQDNGVFMPTGQCINVCLGGHVQTGGYGMLARSFGLLGDYVRELEIVDHNADVVKITRESNPDLFFGFLGGSPGNMGVLTHFTVEVQQDQNFPGSKGLWKAFLFSQANLKQLLSLLVQKAADPNFPRGYDFTVNVVDKEINLASLFPGSTSELKDKLPDNIDNGQDKIADLFKFKLPLIVVYAQWVDLGDEPYSPDLFDQIKNAKGGIITKEINGQAMSTIASSWLFRSAREFPYPYVKRTRTTNWADLSSKGWVDWFAGRLTEAINTKGLYVSSQLQVYGGTKSMFRNNAGNGTAYTFRDATLGGTWDIFYDQQKEAAEKWHAETDKGLAQHFSDVDRRVLWGSYGDWNMKNVWQNYYDEQTYKKLQQVRKAADPQGIFTPNPFCVEVAK